MKTNKAAERNARKMVGDGKLPNMYFLTVSSDYEVMHAEGNDTAQSASETHKDLPEMNATIGQYKTFKEALEALENVDLLSPKDCWEGMHSATIEDRLSGVIYEAEWWEYHTAGRFPLIEFEYEVRKDADFTQMAMEKLGEEFV